MRRLRLLTETSMFSGGEPRVDCSGHEHHFIGPFVVRGGVHALSSFRVVVASRYASQAPEPLF